MIFLSLV